MHATLRPNMHALGCESSDLFEEARNPEDSRVPTRATTAPALLSKAPEPGQCPEEKRSARSGGSRGCFLGVPENLQK